MNGTLPRSVLESAMDSTRLCIAILTGPELRYARVNPAYAALAPDRPMPGRTYTEVFPEAAAAGAEARMRHVLDTGERWQVERSRAPVPGRTDAVWEGEVVRLASDEGGRPAIAVFVNEVTEQAAIERALEIERENLRESEARYRTLFETMQQGFGLAEILIDDAGHLDYRMLELNPQFERLTGQSPAKFLQGQTVREVAPELEEEWFQFYGNVGLTGEAAHREIHAEAWDRWFEVFASRVGDPAQRRVAILFSEITQRKRAEQALHEADRRKDEFLAMLAHELRNPLAPLSTAAHLLQSPALPEPQRAVAQAMIARQVATMTRLVDDLLDVSRLTLGRIELRREPLSLQVAVAQALEAAQPAMEAGRHRLVIERAEPVPWVNADVTRLAQVFTNLLTNAAKYTPPGGKITVSARAEGAEAVVCVRDSGVGIPTEMLTRIFDLFAQVSERNGMSLGGMGIGLALAKQLVELHGGVITAQSEGEGRGSEFIVRLPRVAAPGERLPADPALDGGAAAGCRVLIVDDNVDAAESLAMLLTLEGHRGQAVHSGEAALQAISTESYDAVLLDIGMPTMDGYEVARRIRRRLGERAPVLIALTGWGQAADRARALAFGFTHHLTKPADPTAIARLLQTLRGGTGQ